MKNPKIKMPAMQVATRYGSVKNSFFDCETSSTSVGDPTNSCTTILTTTHFI
jgi:hypothetical protein